MKKIILIALGAACTLQVPAQDIKDDFDSFLNSEISSFDKFIDDANKQFIQFLRDPWKEFEAEKPVEKRTKPEPVKPVVYDKKTAPKDNKPVELNIEKILDQTNKEGKQNPVVKVDNGNLTALDKPKVTKPEPKPEPKPEVKPVTKPEPKPEVKPVTTPEPKPEVKPATKPETKPEVKPATKPETKPEAKPATKPETKPEVKPATKPETKPEVKPVTKPETKPVSVPLPIVKPEKPVVTETPKPVVKPEVQENTVNKVALSYCGQTFYVDKSLKGVCTLSNLREKAVADAYEAMCRADYKTLLADCRNAKKKLALNDWGQYMLVKTISDHFCSDANASVVMQQFLLNELGYKAKMARHANNSKMLLFLATDCMVYGHPYIVMNGLKYYNVNGNTACQFYMCQQDSPNAKNPVTMELQEAPALTKKMVSTFHQSKDGKVKVTVEVPKELMEFYKEYPQVDYNVYFNAPVAKKLAADLLGTLRPLVQGKSEADAANMLLNFVQTGFKYATDEEQFGYEKPFFVEELFYYPACDCEDRSMLYSYLVRQLLGLDVVLLDYPNHIATAVCFKGNVAGDYLTVEGKKYTVCDPTYIGASIGMTMPMFKNVAANVLKY